MRIALVDDSEIERGILLSLITDYGCEKQILFESDCFDSGDAFLSSFSSDKYDIVFMDIFMNGMSGVETAIKMRQIDSHVILIFMTGHTSIRFLTVHRNMQLFSVREIFIRS